MQSTRLGKSWLMKIGIFAILLIFFGCYGLFDALYAYPKRGMADQSYKFKEYLSRARDAGKLSAAGVKVEDPKATFADLKKRADELAKGGESPGNKLELAKLRWLESLAVLWKLKPEPIIVGEGKGMTGSASTGASTAPAASAQGGGSAPVPATPASGGAARTLYFDVGQGTAYALEGPDRTRVDVSLGGLLDELDKKWSKTDQTQPLAGYDLPVQWLFVVIGFGGGLYLLGLILRSAGTKFHWDADSKRLTLPGGRAIVPADLKDVDKRRWHKFYVTLLLNDGSSHALDLYRFDPLERWVLEMEKTAFPDRAQAGAAPAEASSSAESSTTPPPAST